MKQKPIGIGMVIAAFFSTAGLAAALVLLFGTGTFGLGRALGATGRLSFLLFWLAYAGGALRTLFGSAFEPIAARGRDFGLAFAAAQAVHVGLVVWLFAISGLAPQSGPLVWFLAAGVFWTYLLAVLSTRRIARTLGQVRWRMIRLAGMEYVSLVCLFSFVNHPVPGTTWSFVTYALFIALSVMGTFLRLAAWASRGATLAKNA
jgi:hypothetical protein